MGWISLLDKHPREDGYYLTYDGKHINLTAFIFGCWQHKQLFNGEITHWMPLPEPPEDL